MVKILKHSFFMLETLLKDLCTGCIKYTDAYFIQPVIQGIHKRMVRFRFIHH
jgi:hypothetical protein